MRMRYRTFSETIEKYLANRPAVLAIDTAARYIGRLDAELPEKYLNVYVEKIIPELKEVRIEEEDDVYYIRQIKISSFDKIDYEEDEYGIKCSTEEQVVKDILKRGYRWDLKIGMWGAIGYGLTRIVECYCHNYTIEEAKKRLKDLPKRYMIVLKKIVVGMENYN